MAYLVSQSTEEISYHYIHVQINDLELLLMVYQVSQSTEEISYHYIHVQINDL